MCGCGTARALYYYTLISSRRATISSGQSRKLLGGGVLRGEHGIEDEPGIVGDLIPMGVRQFVKDAVSAQQTELAADGCRTAACIGFRGRRGGEEQGLEVAVAQSV